MPLTWLLRFSGLDEAKKIVLMRLATLETAHLEAIADAEL